MYDKCLICEGEFYPGTLKDGKCSVCAKEFPKAKNRDEALRQTVPQKEQMSTLTEMRVRDIVSEEITKAFSILKKDNEKEQEIADRMKKEIKPEKTEEEKRKAKDRMANARAARSSKKETETKKEIE